MAKVYLESTDTAFTVSNNNTSVYGASGDQVVTVASGVTGVTYDQNTERVVFAGASSAYTYAQSGNQILVYSGGVLVATIPVQGDTNGTQLTFTDGTANAVLTTGVMALGGTTVAGTTTTPAAVTPATIDTNTKTPAGSTGTGTTAGQTFTLTGTGSATTLTAGSDTVNASTNLDSIKDSTIVDTSTTDTDTLNITTTGKDAASVVNVENVNVTLKYGSGDTDASKYIGAKIMTVDSSITSETAVIKNVLATNVAAVKAGTNISTVDVRSNTSAGTGSTGVSVDAGSASIVTLTGKSGVTDIYSLALNGGTTFLTTTALADSSDKVTITGNNSDNTVALTTGAKTIVASGAQNMNIKAAVAALGDNTVTNSLTSGKSLTVTVTDVGATTADLSKVSATTIDMQNTTAGTYTFADSANIKLNSDGSVVTTIVAATGASSANVDLATNVVNLAHTTNLFSAINMTANTTDVTSFKITDATEAVNVNLSGSKNVTVESTTQIKTLDASALTGKLTATTGVGATNINTIIGGSNDDKLTMNAANDAFTFVAGAGNDKLVVNAALADKKHVLDAGSGTDTMQLKATTDFSQATAKTSVLSGFETIDVNGQALTLTQAQLNSNSAFILTDTAGSGSLTVKDDATNTKSFNLSALTFTANTTPPTITVDLTGSSNDTVVGSSQADIVKVVAGSNVLDGGAGVDTLDYSGFAAGKIINLSGVTQYLNGKTASSSNLTSADMASTGYAYDYSGTGSSVTVNTSGSKDTISNFEIIKGNAADDLIYGTSANDTIYGAAGADTINGGDGNDYIVGQAGADIINVGIGTDTIVYAVASETFQGAVTSGTTAVNTGDIITGMTAGDKIYLAAVTGLTTATTMTSGLMAVAGVVDAVDYTRGTYDNTSGIWTSAVGGNDLLVQWDSNGTTAVGSVENIVLIGCGANTLTATANATLTLA